LLLGYHGGNKMQKKCDWCGKDVNSDLDEKVICRECGNKLMTCENCGEVVERLYALNDGELFVCDKCFLNFIDE
jgi:uncharacterized Zn finger protein